MSDQSTNPLPSLTRPIFAIGLEGSANKLGIGIIQHSPDPFHPEAAFDPLQNAYVRVLANARHTYITPPGSGFQPSDTARHHRAHALPVLHQALREANLSLNQIDVVCFTKGPGMGAPLNAVALLARMIHVLYGIPLVGVNHCVGRQSRSFGLCFQPMS